MARTVLITGAASGICQATAGACRAAGDRVIGVDMRDADIVADLTTAEGRATLVREAERLAPDGLVVVERSSRDTPPTWPESLTDQRKRRYGETTLYLATKEDDT